MHNYKLVRILSRKNKQDKPYYLAYLILNTDNSCDLLQVLIKEEQAQKLNKLVNDNSFDISKFIDIKYNPYQKSYQPVINY